VTPDTDREADIRRRWPPEQYPALYLPPAEYHALRRRERRRAELLDLLGRDLADIAAADLEGSRDGI
jgi:hypothetical protein